MSLLAADWTVIDKSDAAVPDYVSRVLQMTRAPRPLVERRGAERAPFPHLIELTPVGDNDLVTIGDPSRSLANNWLTEASISFTPRCCRSNARSSRLIEIWV